MIVSLDQAEEMLKDHFGFSPLWKNEASDDVLNALIFREIARLTSRKEARVLKLRWFGERFCKVVRFGHYRKGERKEINQRGLMRLEDVAGKMKISRQWVKVLENRAIEKLKASVKLRAYLREKQNEISECAY
jgi:hypothetical protein